MAEVLFKGAKIQTGDRVKIPKAIIDTLDLKAGDKIIIKFDPIKKKILIEENKK
jgi:bifunctional DNA-binding transcriptional regulator/antitoxin component of YhaV-PrlF toxin-antitoxin module